jgi:hypothetical protein
MLRSRLSTVKLGWIDRKRSVSGSRRRGVRSATGAALRGVTLRGVTLRVAALAGAAWRPAGLFGRVRLAARGRAFDELAVRGRFRFAMVPPRTIVAADGAKTITGV